VNEFQVPAPATVTFCGNREATVLDCGGALPSDPDAPSTAYGIAGIDCASESCQQFFSAGELSDPAVAGNTILGRCEALRGLGFHYCDVLLETTTFVAPSDELPAGEPCIESSSGDVVTGPASCIDPRAFAALGDTIAEFAGHAATVNADADRTNDVIAMKTRHYVESMQCTDEVAPATSAQATGTAGANGWFVSPVTIVLSATDDMDVTGAPDDGAGSAVWEIRAGLGGASDVYAGPLMVSSDGTHILSFRAEDLAGNVEAVNQLSLAIDSAAPATTKTVTDADGDGAIESLTLTCGDVTSGCARIRWAVDGGVRSSTLRGGAVHAHTAGRSARSRLRVRSGSTSPGIEEVHHSHTTITARRRPVRSPGRLSHRRRARDHAARPTKPGRRVSMARACGAASGVAFEVFDRNAPPSRLRQLHRRRQSEEPERPTTRPSGKVRPASSVSGGTAHRGETAVGEYRDRYFASRAANRLHRGPGSGDFVDTDGDDGRPGADFRIAVVIGRTREIREDANTVVVP
jgi:hypothetical protein